ncbi:MAG TPA: UDP-N-acetylmuramate dehydrogenase [Candidatus Didemnitutus sp.]|nr:UDP-N-acetylmuramate dehydrogenase [Candidatus Didemnitutus sp.]
MSTPPEIFGRPLRNVHLLGAGGMGMAPLGLFLVQSGFVVSAEDDGWNPATRSLLERAGVAITPVNGAAETTELVVHSSAVAPTHSARLRAVARGWPVIRRGEMLAEVTRGRRLVAVAGSHGKTTTTAMLITVLARSGFPAGWVLGGLFPDNALPPAKAAGDWIVAEVDESDGTIAGFAPEITVIVNLDWDHSDHYPRPEDMEETFAGLIARTRAAVFASDTCARSHRLTARTNILPVQTFGRTGDFQFKVGGESGATQELQLGGKFGLAHATVRALGEFNAANAAAAFAVAQHMGAKVSADSLASYAGVARRQTCLHLSERHAVFEDYAHHPTEIRALLASLRGRGGRLVVVFQPHRYTRTAQFKTEFAAALAGADQLFLLDVYAASESPVSGGTTADIYAEIKKSGAQVPVSYLPGDTAGVLAALRASMRAGDTIAFVGAGDIDHAARDFVERLRRDEQRDLAWREFLSAVKARLGTETRLAEFERLGPKTTMRIGGPARVYAEPATEDDLQVLLATAHERKLPVLMLGRGSNLLVPDDGVDALVISLAHANWQSFAPKEDGRVWVGAGLRLKNLCGLAAKHGLVGFEFMEGIPASVGGALRMNAGAMGGWTFDVVDEVHLMTLAGEKRVMKKSEMHVDYRHCTELETAVALGAFIRPSAQATSPEIKRQIEGYQKKRVESQPREPSAGCIFKNPPGIGAGRLIDEVGLKGERIGDAEVSPVHANFIVNRGHATSADVLALVRRIRERVKSVRGIDLQPEVMLFGRDWRDVL